jgi:Mrp family chromosome partitioning ATPase
MLDQATELAGYVIVDSPPLTAVVDTLPLARQADDVLIVSRLGLTRLDRLRELAELLASNEISPVGFVLVGTPRRQSSYYYEDLEGRETPSDYNVISESVARREVERTR